MPIYEYICRGCKGEFELLVPPGRRGVACPHCGSRKLARKLSVFAAHRSSATPCRSGECPASLDAAARSRCAAGSCPFSS